MSRFDRVLILGDFNIHVCCPSSSSFTMDFIDIVKSFNLTQSVEGPTQLKRTHSSDFISESVNLY